MRRGVTMSVLLGAALLALGLSGCATLVPKAPPRSPATGGAARPFDPSLLSAGMSMHAVRRLEPPPDEVFSMTSGAMSVVKWVYEPRGNRVVLYFANGILQSWSP